MNVRNVNRMTDLVRETLAKFDHALPNILDSDRLTSLIAVDSVLLYVYVLRCHHRDRLGGEDAYRAIASKSAAGRTTEALVLVRNTATHDLSKLIAPRPSLLYPGFFPGKWTFTGMSLKWLTIEETNGALGDKPKPLVDAYRQHLEGHPVGYAFDAAREFLVSTLGSI
jgi:hypothetical protein